MDKRTEAAADPSRQEPEYLGDGVYAFHDGAQIWLTVGDHRNAGLVAVDGDVLTGLVGYARRIGLSGFAA